MDYNINFNLKTPSGARETPIMVSVTGSNIKRFRLSTGKAIKPAHWNKNEQRANSRHPGFDLLNRLLNQRKNEIHAVCLQLSIDRKPITKESVTAGLSFYKRPGETKSTFVGAFQQFIDEQKIHVSENRIKSYRTCIVHLETFAANTGFQLFFDAINDSFYSQFKKYLLYDQHGFNGNFGKQINVLKRFMKWAAKNGYHSTDSYKEFAVLKEDDKDMVTLTIDELNAIERLELDTRLDQVRDLFLIGCYTGLRFADIQNLKEAHIKNGQIRMHAQKTRGLLVIEMHSALRRIFEKYKAKGLPRISNQKMNDYIKEVAQKANMVETFIEVKYRGVTPISEEKKKYEKISSHTARRTFITISRKLGIDSETVMKIVGHKRHSTMHRYVHLDNAHIANEFKKWDKVVVVQGITDPA
jgi:site-specific recombinase XerD